MAKKKNVAPRLPPPPLTPLPAAAQSGSSDEDYSSDDEDQFIAKPNPGSRKNPIRDEDDSDSDSRSDSKSDNPPPTKPLDLEDSSSEEEEGDEKEKKQGTKKTNSPATKSVAVPPKPLELEDSSDDEADEEEKKQYTKKTKSKCKQPESTTEKAKPKSSEPGRPGSKKSSGIQRVWSPKDEMTVLNAFLDYKVKNGKLPPRNEYTTLLSTFSGSLAFSVTENQVYNKIRMAKLAYRQKKTKGHGATFQQPHDVEVYKIYKELFGDLGESSNKRSAEKSGANVDKKKRKKQKVDIRRSGSEGAYGGRVGVGVGVAVDKGGDGARPCSALEEMIQDLIGAKQSLRWLSIEDVMAFIRETKLQDLEAKAKVLEADLMKWRGREAELLDLGADGMAGD